MLTKQDWVETTERIDCPAPLPEDPATALLTEMLFLAPYEVPEKKAKEKAMGPGRVFGARLCQSHRPKTPRHAPPMKTMRRKKKALPS